MAKQKPKANGLLELAVNYGGYSDSGKRMPVDAEPDALKGTVRVEGDQGRVLTSVELLDAAMAAVPLFVSHFVTCPNARSHRKPR